MTFLDSSTIIEYLRDNQTVIDYLDNREPWWTSTICVFEVLNGPAGSSSFDPIKERQTFSGVQALEFKEQLAFEAARLQDASIKDGSELSHRDAPVNRGRVRGRGQRLRNGAPRRRDGGYEPPRRPVEKRPTVLPVSTSFLCPPSPALFMIPSRASRGARVLRSLERGYL